MTSEIRVYVEGGGADGKTKRPFRQGLNAFFGDLKEQARAKRIRFEIVACGSRSSAYDDFRIALRSHPHAFNVLLVDAEAPVTAGSPWQHLKNRKEDQWENPGTANDRCQLMVQTMEAWLIADVESLADYYGQGFQKNALPANSEVETIDKTTVDRSLMNATRNTKKGRYHKTFHLPEILARIRASIVRRKAPYCDRLFRTLETEIKDAG